MIFERDVRFIKKLNKHTQVVWAEPKLKFIREHSIAFPAPSWLVTHTKWMVSTLVILLVMHFLCTFVFFRRPDSPASGFFLYAIFFILLCDICHQKIREYQFVTYLIDRRDATILPFDQQKYKRNLIIGTVIIGIMAILFGVMSLRVNSFGYMISVIALIPTFSQGSQDGSPNPVLIPTILLDLDKGVFFGGALFSYETMNGFCRTSGENGFELYHCSKRVAWGKMPQDEMKNLLEMIMIHKKYGTQIHRETPHNSILFRAAAPKPR